MPITTADHVSDCVANARKYPYQKVFSAPKAAGSYQSGWMATGLPAAGLAPAAYTAGAGYTSDRNTTGALGQVNGAIQNWLARLSCGSQVNGSLLLVDRLWSCTGMGFAAATYTITTPGALPARITDNGLGVEAWCEHYATPSGAASGTLTFNYLDEGGAAGAGVIPAVVSAPVAGQTQPVPRAAGDLGVKSAVSVVTSATWTSGTAWGITLAKRIAEISVDQANVMKKEDWSQVLAKVHADACIQMIWLATATTAPSLLGSIDIGDK